MPASGSDQLGIGDKLAFLVCYSRYYLSITAENHGQLSQLLSQELEGATPVCRLVIDDVRKYDLPVLIASGFGLREASPGSSIVLESLDMLIKNSVVRPLVTVDDGEPDGDLPNHRQPLVDIRDVFGFRDAVAHH